MHYIFDTDMRKWLHIPSLEHTSFIGSLKDHTVEFKFTPLKAIRELTSIEIDNLMINYYKEIL